MFACLYAPPRGLAFRGAEGVPRARRVTDELVRLAREYSPRIELHGDNLVVLDTTGLTSLFGDTRELGATLRRSAADRGLYLRLAVASTRTAALLVVQARSGLTVIDPGEEAATLAALPLDVLKTLAQGQAQRTATRTRRGARVSSAALAIPAFTLLSTIRRWGVRTLGDLARLPSAELFERLGAGGVTLQRFARGEDAGPLVPAPVEERFESSLALEWPVEGLEPLSFVLSRVFEQVCARLERAGVGAAVIHVHLKLVTRAIHTRTLHLPAPLRDPRVLRTLVLLDLESHAPSAGIDQVTVVVDPVPARTQQFSLLERVRPAPETVSTLVARLTALAGAGRCGSPALVDSHDTASFEMRAFVPDQDERASAPVRSAPRRHQKHGPPRADKARTSGRGADRVRETPVDGDWRQNTRACAQETGDAGGRRRFPQPPAKSSKDVPLVPVLRRFRAPVAARVAVRHGRPVRVEAPRVSGGAVMRRAGPWRTSGQWWTDAGAVSPGASPAPTPAERAPWDRDEWDVALTDGGVYRIFHDRRADRWFLEGMVD